MSVEPIAGRVRATNPFIKPHRDQYSVQMMCRAMIFRSNLLPVSRRRRTASSPALMRRRTTEQEDRRAQDADRREPFNLARIRLRLCRSSSRGGRRRVRTRIDSHPCEVHSNSVSELCQMTLKPRSSTVVYEDIPMHIVVAESR
jgi:hypothetical protein